MSVGFGLGLSGGSDKLVNLPLLSSLGGKVRGGVAFTRASGQWYQNDSGVWQYAANGVPAFNSKGILLEPASTNKCTCYGAIPSDNLASRVTGANLVAGNKYTIVTRATVDFTLYGAANNNVGTSFIATGGVTLGAGDSVNLVQFAIGTKSYYNGVWVQNHTNMTLSGDTAAVLTTVDDWAALLTAGLQNLCPSGKVYKLDNSSGVADAFITFNGAAGNTNAHSMSVQARVNAGGSAHKLRFGSGEGSVDIPVSASFGKVKSENVIAGSTSTIQLIIRAGSTAYFILPQLEEFPFATSPIPTAGATATRAATTCTFPVSGNTKSNDFTVCGVVEFAAVAPNASPQVFVANGAGGTSVAVQMSTASMSFYAQRILPGPVYKTTGANVVAIGQQLRFAAVFSSTGIRFFLNGVHQAPANVDGTAIDLAGTLVIPSTGSSKRLRNFRIYRRALSDAQCIALTT